MTRANVTYLQRFGKFSQLSKNGRRFLFASDNFLA